MGLSYAELDDIYTVPSSPTPVQQQQQRKMIELDGIHFVFLYIIALFLFTIK